MASKIRRRAFLRNTLGLSAAGPLAAASFEEMLLLAHASEGSVSAPALVQVPCGMVGNVKISRLICGGNLISGYAHSRDLIYVSSLLRNYFTDAKVIETWARCEAHGINTMILNPSDQRALALYERYRKDGGKIQYLAQISPPASDLRTLVGQSRDAGASGAFLVGNLGDLWTREGQVARIGALIAHIKEAGMISGVAGHELRTVMAVEGAGIAPDFYMKTLHSTSYWSSRKPDQTREVIDNYAVDNYWCLDPQKTVAWMSALERPWIAYKVLAAGALPPRAGFKFAFENGADFAAVGMFDFQIAEDAAIACKVIEETRNRGREWMA